MIKHMSLKLWANRGKMPGKIPFLTKTAFVLTNFALLVGYDSSEKRTKRR
jgi:hypothetical protein